MAVFALVRCHQAAISIHNHCQGLPVGERLPMGMNLVSAKMGLHEWSYKNDYNPGRRAALRLSAADPARDHGRDARRDPDRRQHRDRARLPLCRCHGRRLIPDHTVDQRPRCLSRALRAVSRRSRDRRYCILQAEDELAAIGMVIGAAWNGARAFTATSGPGISLMTELVGLAYYAEIPAVIIDVQRVGPSTGMPTRTQQGDILLCAYASHGDTKHILLFLANPHECFAFAVQAFDLAERFQTPVFILSDLDIGTIGWCPASPGRMRIALIGDESSRETTSRPCRSSIATRPRTSTVSRPARCRV